MLNNHEHKTYLQEHNKTAHHHNPTIFTKNVQKGIDLVQNVNPQCLHHLTAMRNNKQHMTTISNSTDCPKSASTLAPRELLVPTDFPAVAPRNRITCRLVDFPAVAPTKRTTP